MFIKLFWCWKFHGTCVAWVMNIFNHIYYFDFNVLLKRIQRIISFLIFGMDFFFELPLTELECYIHHLLPLLWQFAQPKHPFLNFISFPQISGKLMLIKEALLSPFPLGHLIVKHYFIVMIHCTYVLSWILMNFL